MDLKKQSEGIYELNEPGMKVPARVIASDEMIPLLQSDRTLQQIRNVAMLPGIVKNALLMPDGHEGYGFPIGGVAAFDAKQGIVSPGGVGYDINCGIRMVIVDIPAQETKAKLRELVDCLFHMTPSGLGSKSHVRISREEVDEVAEKGIDWAIAKGYASKEDKEATEELGRMKGADPSKVSIQAKDRGKSQVGSTGSGNHFVEIQEIQEVYDQEVGKKFGLEKGKTAIMIHSGSRGYGHQICSDYLKVFNNYLRNEGIELPDRELVYAKLDSQEAQDYLGAMACAVNFAFCNRQLLMDGVRSTFNEIFGIEKDQVKLVYDVCHNIAKFEEHEVDGENLNLCVHRKGATRAFAARRKELSSKYSGTGHPVIIPGSMGTASYVLVGTQKAMELTFGSTCHGAGRIMSRKAAIQSFGKGDLAEELSSKGIIVKTAGGETIAEEAPGAYKDIDMVIGAVELAGIARKIARTVPLGVVKG